MIAIRAGAGLGDALYLQSIARYLIERGRDLEICSDWWDVFRPLAQEARSEATGTKKRGTVLLSRFRRAPINLLAHYTGRKGVEGTTQFQDSCLAAGITEPVDLRLDWKPTRLTPFLEPLRQVAKPVIIVQLPRAPMGRSDGFGAELLPNCGRIQRIIDTIGDRAWFVQVGAGEALYRFRGLDLDLAGQTTVTGLLDVASIGDGFLGYPSFIVPLAEGFSAPLLAVFSRRGLMSETRFVRQITPEKVLHKSLGRPEAGPGREAPTSVAIVDDCDDAELETAAHAFCHQAGDRRALRR